MDAADPVVLPKYHALVDFGHGLYKGYDLHTQTLARAVARTKRGLLLLADGVKYEIVNGTISNPQPHSSKSDLRFVWSHV